jgi:hypothetical protein
MLLKKFKKLNYLNHRKLFIIEMGLFANRINDTYLFHNLNLSHKSVCKMMI